MPDHDPVYKVTIIPRGRALGVTMFLPEEDRYSLSRQAIRSQICSLFGGRIAEEMILGGILLDPDAIGRVADVLQPEAFYTGAHREIFRTALMLHGQGKPTDLTAMVAWLADTGQLEKVGGSKRLSELVDRTFSTASIEEVAKLVMDKHLRRQLIRSGNEVIGLGFDQGKPMDQVLDLSLIHI